MTLGAGVDMSESALQTAQGLMQDALGLEQPLFFHVADMLSFLKQAYAAYDIVLAAFSLHHLTPEDKKQVKSLHASLRVRERRAQALYIRSAFYHQGTA